MVWAKNPYDATISTDSIRINHVYATPVGSIWTPTNKLHLPTPCTGLFSPLTVTTASIVYNKHRKKPANLNE